MSISPPSPRALTVLVLARQSTEDVVAVLADYSAVGLLAPFAWVEAADVGGPSTPATLVTEGRSEPVVLQQVLTAARYDRIRVAVLVPAEAPAALRVPLAVEQSVEQVVRSSSMGAKIALLRILITTGTAAPMAADPTLVLEGWHNLLIAPEDSAGPGLGAVSWGRITDPLDIACRTAPVVAAIAGLWAHAEQTPFDTVEILPGQTLRAVRAFYRHLDSSDVEARLRAQLFDPAGRLPLPHGGQIPVVYVDDVAAASQSMARALWTKHRDVLRGPRLTTDGDAAQAISVWAALKMFFTFMGASLRSAPAALLQAMLGSVTSVVASTVQGAMFGGKESAFAVVTNTDVANWQDLGRSAETLSAALGGPEKDPHVARSDLGPLWSDFVNGALTLADGGRRTAGLDPIAVGSGVGVLPNAAAVVPSAAEQFAAIPTSLAAVIGVSSLAATEVLGAANLRDSLQRAYTDPTSGVEARSTATALDRWQQAAAKSYAWQAGSILVDFLHRARTEVAQLAGQIQTAANKVSADELLRARQQTIATILKTLTWALLGVLIVLVGVAAFGWARWGFALTTGAVLLIIYVALSLALFLLSQRDLFAEMNLRKSQASQLQTMQANLRTALADVSRLSMAYGQLQAWSRALGAVLRAPFGPPPPAQPQTGQLVDGLPRSTQIGLAAPTDRNAGDAIHAIQRRLYALGWLTQPWADMVEGAAATLREEPQTLLKMPGLGTGSGLDQWANAVAVGQVQPTGADALWARVEQMFSADTAVADALTGTVMVSGQPNPVSAAQFGAGITDHRRGHGAPFDAALFSPTATTAGRTAVAIDELTLARGGLGYRAVVVHAGDGLPPYDFAMFTPPVAVAPGNEDEVTTLLSKAEQRDTPPGEDMVF